jgi:coiled-coil domain-containing protein 55
MSAENKLTLSFGGIKVPGVEAASKGAPKSNMQALMAKTKPKPKLTSLFDEDDEESGPAPAPSLAGPSRPRPGAPPSRSMLGAATSLAPLPRASRKAQEEALKLDASVFDYDGVYDQLKSRERAAEADQRKPKYMDNFLASAQTRKLDKLRAEEKMLAHEREKEGGQFEDKEKYVTEGYKKQMEEVKRAEEEERAREGTLTVPKA